MFLLFQKCFGDFLQVINPTFLLNLLEVLINQVHVAFVLVDNLYFLLVLAHQVF